MNSIKLKKFLLGIFVMMTLGGLTAQTIVPENGTITHNDKLRPCIVISLDPNPDELKDAWRDYLNDNYDFKLKGIGFLQNKDLLSAEEVIIKKISSDKIEFYTNIVENELGSEMKVFAAFGEDKYIGRDNMRKEYKALNNIVESFLKEYLPVYYREMLEDTNKNFIDLTDDVTDLNEELVDDTEEIEKLKKEIEDLNENIENNREILEKTKVTLSTTEKKLARIRAQSVIYNK